MGTWGTLLLKVDGTFWASVSLVGLVVFGVHCVCSVRLCIPTLLPSSFCAYEFFYVSSLGSLPLGGVATAEGGGRIGTPGVLAIKFFAAPRGDEVAKEVGPCPTTVVSWVECSHAKLFYALTIAGVTTDMSALVVNGAESASRLYRPIDTSRVGRVVMPVVDYRVTFFDELCHLGGPVSRTVRVIAAPPTMGGIRQVLK